MLTVRIQRTNPAVPLPKYETAGAAGFDLAAAADVVVPPGSVALVPTGLIVEVPPGHFLGIFARSSTPLRRGLLVANGVGVIDEDYCGPKDEIKIQVLNFTQAAVTVSRGDRIAQGLFLPVTRVEWQERDGPPRAGGRGGIGGNGETVWPAQARIRGWVGVGGGQVGKGNWARRYVSHDRLGGVAETPRRLR